MRGVPTPMAAIAIAWPYMSCSAVVETPPAPDGNRRASSDTESGAVHTDRRAAGPGRHEKEWKG